MKVKDCMCNEVCCVKPDAKVFDVAKLMNENHVGSIPVCDSNNCVCGIVTDRDIILRSVVCEKDPKQTPVSEIMSCNVCTCGENDDMTNAENKMAENQIRRLPVCDNNNKIVGILTLKDLTENSNTLGEEDVCSTIGDICDCGTNTKNGE